MPCVIAFPAPTANWGTVSHFAIFDAATGRQPADLGCPDRGPPDPERRPGADLQPGRADDRDGLMAFDAHKNLAVSAVVTAPTPATSGTSLVVTAGDGARFPAPPFNVTMWPVNAQPDALERRKSTRVHRAHDRHADDRRARRKAAPPGYRRRRPDRRDHHGQNADRPGNAGGAPGGGERVHRGPANDPARGPRRSARGHHAAAPMRGRWTTLNYSQALSFAAAERCRRRPRPTALEPDPGRRCVYRAAPVRTRPAHPAGARQTWNAVGTTAEGAALGGTVASAFTRDRANRLLSAHAARA